MTKLLIGHADKTEQLLHNLHGGFLLIDDGELCDAFLDTFPRAVEFSPYRDSFNPLAAIDVPSARAFATAVYGDKDLMTYRDGKRALTRMLLNAQRLDHLPQINHKGCQDARDTMDDLLLSPVLKQALCGKGQFSFKPRRKIVARLNRAELGDFDARILGTLLIGQFQGQVIVPDGGFYLRDIHTSLIRQNRLIAGLNSLSETSPALQQALLGIKHKIVYRTTREDADRLMFYIDPRGNPNILVDLNGDHYRETR